MIRKGKKVLDSKGSAFIVVLIALLFVGIIAAAVLGLAHNNLENIGTGIKSSDNFYEAEEALDELKDSLKQMANEAVKQAYEDYLQLYAINALSGMNADQLKLEFNRLFSANIESRLAEYFTKSGETGDPAKDYADLLYKHLGVVTTDPTIKPTYRIDENNIVHIENIKLTYYDDEGKLSTISTDLSFDVNPPSITVGSNVGLSTSVADFALISDQTIKNDNSSPIIMGSIYGGGKNPSGLKDEEGKDVYDQPGILISGSGVNAKLYSNLIISRSSIETCNHANLEIRHSNDKRQAGIVGDYYSSIWVQNILMDTLNANDDKSANSSNIKIKGKCFVSDDLTINTDSSSFELLGNMSEYFGYNTNKRLSDGSITTAESSSSIVINGKAVTLDLSKANMLWLAGKSYVNVPEEWGDTTGPSKTFQQGESISYRSLQAAYMLPGECVMGIGHNPLNLDDYISLLDFDDATKAELVAKARSGNVADINAVITQVALKKPKVEISQSFLNEGMDLTKYLDLDNPCSVEFVKYDNKKLAYIYMNFRTPNKAAEYFRDYFNKYNELVKGRMSLFGTTGKLLINTASESYNSTLGVYMLGTSHVQSTGNIVYYDGGEMKLYCANTDYQAVKNQQTALTNQFKNLKTSLDSSVSLLDQPLTENITNIDKINEDGSKVVRIEDEDDASHPQYRFRIGDVNDYGASVDPNGRLAFMITSTGNVVIDSGKVIVDGVSYGRGDGDIGEQILAGIVIAKGTVTIRNGTDFWGTIIAQKDIILEGGAQVYAASADVRKLIQVNTTVIPYFSKDTGGSKEDGEGVNSLNLVNVIYDNWKKD